MRAWSWATLLAVVIGAAPATGLAQAEVTVPAQPDGPTLNQVVDRLLEIIDPSDPATAKTFSTRLVVTRAEGLPKQVKDAVLEVAYQFPDRLQLAATVKGEKYIIGRDGEELWAYVPGKQFGVVAAPGVQRFAGDPGSIDLTQLEPFALPLSLKTQIKLAAFTLTTENKPAEEIDGVKCAVLAATLPKTVSDVLKLPEARLEVAVRLQDQLPARLRFSDGSDIHLEVAVQHPVLSEPWPAERWKLKAREGDAIKRVALSHLTTFISVAASSLNQKIPTLGPAKGERKLVATAGAGRVERWDGTRVLFLKGTPQEMGRQQGTLLKKEIRDVGKRILYGVGVGSSFPKGRWFFGEIEAAHARLAPYIEPRAYEEMDALADAAGLNRQEIRLANFFPELFHCSGFAISGRATAGGRMYHGRILDYLKGMGLEQNAVVMVYQPRDAHAWVNIGYAGFIGTVTAMNEKQISIGEMGGRGEGNWDGKPMAQLMREVMEKASTLEEAVEIMRRGPRTCEYHYVIADGKSRKAIGIKATPTLFETVEMGQTHPQLPDAVQDAVLLSAGDRYKKLVERVKAGFGRFDDVSARALMERPVCMTSNIQSVLFAPDNLDFWVANADAENVASHTRYTKYNLKDLLTIVPASK